MKKILSKLNSDEVLEEAANLLQAAFQTQNMGKKYTLFQEANDLKFIAKKLFKYEKMNDQGDL